MQTKSTSSCTSSLVKMPLEVHELRLFGFNNLGESIDFDFCLFLIIFKLRFHLESLPLRVEKLVVGLTEDSFHLIYFMSHRRVLVFNQCELTH